MDQIDRNPEQPRKHFDEEQLEELKESILAHGVLEPIIVRPVEGRYEIVVGERRWRAAQLAGLDTIPAVVRRCPIGRRWRWRWWKTSSGRI